MYVKDLIITVVFFVNHTSCMLALFFHIHDVSYYLAYKSKWFHMSTFLIYYRLPLTIIIIIIIIIMNLYSAGSISQNAHGHCKVCVVTFYSI